MEYEFFFLMSKICIKLTVNIYINFLIFYFKNIYLFKFVLTQPSSLIKRSIEDLYTNLVHKWKWYLIPLPIFVRYSNYYVLP